MKRSFKCVSNQKCSTGNLQSLRGRCEMCSPCHFCHDRSTHHALLCQIPPPSRCSSSHVLDDAVRKPRENPSVLRPAPPPTPHQLSHWPREGFTNKNPTCVHRYGKFPEYPGFMREKRAEMREKENRNSATGKKRSIPTAMADMMNGLQRIKSWQGTDVFHRFPLLCGSVLFLFSCEN